MSERKVIRQDAWELLYGWATPEPPSLADLGGHLQFDNLQSYWRESQRVLRKGCGFVYGLTDPRKDDRIAYVGQTNGPVVMRYLAHLTQLGPNDSRSTWITGLLNQRRAPGLVVIETPKRATLLAREWWWILSYQAVGDAWANRKMAKSVRRLYSELAHEAWAMDAER